MREFTQFGGVVPSLDAKLLPEPKAQQADNCRFDKGGIYPAWGDSVIDGVTLSGAPVSIYRRGDTWYSWTTWRDVVQSPIVLDSRGRFYTSGGAYMTVNSGSDSFRNGVPRPDPPTADTYTTPTEAEASEDVVYIITIVDEWGLESAPSDPSATITRKIGTDVTLTTPSLPNLTGRNLSTTTGTSKWRLYRSNTGTEATSFQFVADYPWNTYAGGASITDDVSNSALGEVIPDEVIRTFEPPNDNVALFPDGPIQGVVSYDNGVIVGFTGKTIVASEPYLPHSFPVEFYLAVEHTIVALAPMDFGCVVLTSAQPYVLLGPTPGSYVSQRYRLNEPAVSKEAVARFESSTYYVSPNGLIKITQDGVENVTAGVFDREGFWRPNSANMTLYRDDTIVLVRISGSTTLYVYDTLTGNWSTRSNSSVAGCGWYDTERSIFYYRDGEVLKSFETDTASLKTMTWQSPLYTSLTTTSFSAAYVFVDPASQETDVATGVNLTAFTVSVLDGAGDAVTSVTQAAANVTGANAHLVRFPGSRLREYAFKVVSANLGILALVFGSSTAEVQRGKR